MNNKQFKIDNHILEIEFNNNIFTNRQKNILENKLQKLYKKHIKSLTKWKKKY